MGLGNFFLELLKSFLFKIERKLNGENVNFFFEDLKCGWTKMPMSNSFFFFFSILSWRCFFSLFFWFPGFLSWHCFFVFCFLLFTFWFSGLWWARCLLFFFFLFFSFLPWTLTFLFLFFLDCGCDNGFFFFFLFN